MAAVPNAHAVNYSATGATGGGGTSRTAPQTCDPQYWESMSSRAWMEAQREISQNKNLIYKPDSVLEYVCFDSFMQHAAQHVGDVFTHTTYFNGQMIIPRDDERYSLEQTLTKVVTNSYKTYIESNFGHKFLGERSAHLGRHAAADRTLGDASAMGEYKCTLMANIWTQAKCENFIDNEKFEGDGFFPFDDLKPGPGGNVEIKGYKNRTDPRIFPAACQIAQPDNSANHATWDAAILRATNKNDDRYPFSEPLKAVYDEIRPKLEPGTCSINRAILTGVTVITDAGNKQGHPDGICSNPGCSFQKDGTCAAN